MKYKKNNKGKESKGGRNETIVALICSFLSVQREEGTL